MVPPFPERVGKSLSLVSSIPRPTERFSVILLVGVLCLTLGGSANAVGGANNKLFVFHGKIQAVDTAARTFTLQTNKQNYVFVTTDQTKITRNGKAQQFADLKPGQPAEVEMQIGAGDKGMAVSVRLIRNSYQLDYRVRELQLQSQLQSLFVATTPSGKTISGTEVNRLVVHKPRFEPIWHGPSFGPSTRLDVFLLSVRPDGTVSNVEVLRETGYDVLDKRTKEWITKWRFRPNSVVQVRVPVQLVRSRY
jgi:TonB family protein